MKNIIRIIFYLVFGFFPTMIIAQFSEFNFPLDVGNRWQYSESGHNIESIALKDTTMSNGKEYAKVVGPLFNGLFRKEGLKVYLYSEFADSEFVKYDFSLRINDTVAIEVRGLDTILTTVNNVDSSNIFGNERKYLTYLTRDINDFYHSEEQIVDGLGLVQYSGELLFYGLSGAVINGVEHGQIVDVNDTTENIPSNFNLFQNYPNPFNPTTIISYEIENSEHVKINIYDVLGNYISTLINEWQNRGVYQLKFDGWNLSSGVYFYNIIINNNVQTKRMLLLN